MLIEQSMVQFGVATVYNFTAKGIRITGGLVNMGSSTVTRTSGGPINSGSDPDVELGFAANVSGDSSTFGSNVSDSTLTANGILYR